MDIDRLLELLLAGGLAGLVAVAVTALEKRRSAAREDRKQAVDEKATAATAADTITKAATSLVALQDAQVDDLKALIEQQRKEMQARLDAQGAELDAYNTRLNIEIQNRLRAEARASINEDRIKDLDNKLSALGAQFEMVSQDNAALRRENGAMKTKIFEMAVGIQALNRQVREAGREPEYVLDVPVSSTGRLGPIDVEAVNRMSQA